MLSGWIPIFRILLAFLAGMSFLLPIQRSTIPYGFRRFSTRRKTFRKQALDIFVAKPIVRANRSNFFVMTPNFMALSTCDHLNSYERFDFQSRESL